MRPTGIPGIEMSKYTSGRSLKVNWLASSRKCIRLNACSSLLRFWTTTSSSAYLSSSSPCPDRSLRPTKMGHRYRYPRPVAWMMVLLVRFPSSLVSFRRHWSKPSVYLRSAMDRYHCDMSVQPNGKVYYWTHQCRNPDLSSLKIPEQPTLEHRFVLLA